jgi:hypothetical protein
MDKIFEFLRRFFAGHCVKAGETGLFHKKAQRRMKLHKLGSIIFFRLFAISILIPVLSFSQNNFRTAPNDAFQSGEYLKYRVYYDSWLTSWITAGYGTMSVEETKERFLGREAYHIVVTGKSTRFFNLFMKVNDRFESYFDKKALLPWKFIRRTREGSYVKDDDVVFDYDEMAVTSRQMTRPIPEGLQDMVSAFYYMRTFNFDTATTGDEYHIQFYLDDSIYHSRIEFIGREMVETHLGVFPCLKFKPQVATGEVFTEQYPMVLWVSDDRNKIPVLGKSAVYVGSITIELVEYSGLIHPLTPLRE